MHILHILDHSLPLHSGYTFRSRAIIEQQRKMGWDTDHVTSPKHNLATTPASNEEIFDGLKFYRTPARQSVLSKVPIINQFEIVRALQSRLLEIVPKINPTILHAHSPALNGLAAINVGAKLGIPVVYEIRAFWEDAAVDHGTSKEGGLRYKLTRALETYVIKNADAVTTICEGLRGDIIARGVAEDKVTVIPNAVDIEQFQYGAEPDKDMVRRLDLHNKLVIGFIGSFYAYEGLHILLEAVSAMLDKIPNLAVLLVGGGPQEVRLKEIVAKNRLEKTVIFTGRVPHNEVQSYYNLIDILVYPRMSIRLTELVTPLKPLEAMAQGRLLLASNIGGHRELIEDRKTGVFFEPGDPQSLANSVCYLLENREQWPAIRDAARRFVEQERNWANSVSRYKLLYEKLVTR